MNMIKPGQVVYWNDMSAVVLELKGYTDLIIRIIETNETKIAAISSVSVSPHISKQMNTHLLASDKEWQKAVERYELISPLLHNGNRTSEDINEVASIIKKSPATIYRWINKFENTGLVSSLLREHRSDKGVQRLSSEVEQIISSQIDSYYLKKERPSVSQLYRRIKLACREINVLTPHQNTIYARIKELEQVSTITKRYSAKYAKEKFEPLKGKFPGANYPNAVVQIDHTKVDIIVVDEQHRLPIGRPYLTIAIDVATKMITGFYLSLDPPGSLSAGLCIAHAVLRKDHWLAKRNITEEWPIYGKMQKIHVDNAKEFHGKMLERACQQHGIILEHRPKGRPNYGPHVERAFRTFMSEHHSLPGTTFSNSSMKMDYDSEGNACMTLHELELWFTTFIVYCYHHRPHKGINNASPIKLYYQLIHGNNEYPGTGIPWPITDEETFKLDFTPYVERTIQRQGVVIDNIHYFSPVLRKWIATKDKKDNTKMRKFIFARDPRNISMIHFLDPDTLTYVPIPYLNNARPTISLWELNAITKNLNVESISHIDEEMIFKGIKKMREVEENAIEKTKLAKQQRTSEKRKRRMAERRSIWKKQTISPEKGSQQSINNLPEDLNENIQPFSDIQFM